MQTKTERLIIRERDNKDLEIINSIYDDLEVSKNLISVPHPFTLKDAREKIDYVSESIKKKRQDYILGIDFEDKLIGVISLLGVNNLQKSAHLHFTIKKDYPKRVFGFESSRNIIKFAFDNLGLKLIESKAFLENRAYIKLLEKLRFRKVFLLNNLERSEATKKLHDIYIFRHSREDFLCK